MRKRIWEEKSVEMLIFIGIYLILMFGLPAYLLFDWIGLGSGFLVLAVFLVWIRAKTEARLLRTLRVSRVLRADSPCAFASVKLFSQMLGVSPPLIFCSETSSVNVGLFGFRASHPILVVTRGALNNLTRDELSALIAWQIVRLKKGRVGLETWLSGFLSAWHPLIQTNRDSRKTAVSRVLFQIVLFPILIWPIHSYVRRRKDEAIDDGTAKLIESRDVLRSALKRTKVKTSRKSEEGTVVLRHHFVSPSLDTRENFLTFLLDLDRPVLSGTRI